MPRDGSGIYTTPAGTTAVPDTTIESAKYNGNVADVAADLNAARPIIAGGTGATSAAAARANLNVEIEGQQVVNFDTHVWEGGSFWADVSATAGPVASHYFTGFVTRLNDNPDWIVIEAYDLSAAAPGVVYTRRKQGGVWQPWVQRAATQTEADARYVNVTGDTMSGALHVAPAAGNAQLWLDAPAAASPVVISQIGGSLRWIAYLGNDFSLQRYNDAGSAIDSPLIINRVTGAMTISGTLTAQAKGHQFGGASGAGAVTAVSSADANIKLYDNGGANWAGIGTDTGGNIWLRAGLSGSPLPLLALLSSEQVVRAQATMDATNGFTLGGMAQGTMPGWGAASTGGEFFNQTPDGPVIIVSRAGTNVGLWNVNTAGAMHNFSKSGVQVGSISVSATNTAFNTSSDGRLKEDLKSFEAGHIIDDTMVYDFKWKDTDERAYGVVAQEAKDVYDTPVFYSPDTDRWFIDYSKYVPVILQELKALRARVAQLEGRTDMKPPPS